MMPQWQKALDPSMRAREGIHSHPTRGQAGSTDLFEQHGFAEAGRGFDVAVDPLRHEVCARHFPVVRPRVHRLIRQPHTAFVSSHNRHITHLCWRDPDNWAADGNSSSPLRYEPSESHPNGHAWQTEDGYSIGTQPDKHRRLHCCYFYARILRGALLNTGAPRRQYSMHAGYRGPITLSDFQGTLNLTPLH